MKIAILGYGEQGKSAYEYWQIGNDITICDQNPIDNLPAGVHTQTGEGYLSGLGSFDMIIRSPAVHPKDILAANDERTMRKVTTVTEEFFRVCPAPIIGVTGTKGKGTTSSLITAMLRAAGKIVHLGGNIGIPPLDLLKNNIQPSDFVVLELANFQLIDLRVSPSVAVCLMVAPEHLDWHKDVKEYISAKQNLFRYQDDNARAVFNRLSDFSGEVVSVSPALKVSYEVPPKGLDPSEQTGAYVLGDKVFMDDAEICSVSDVALLGRHNLENVCAAIAAVWKIVEENSEPLRHAIQHFKGLEHRLELVREVNGVKYYDDSFGTTPETATVAIQVFSEPKVVILGGSDKNADFAELAKIVGTNNVRSVVLIGETSTKIQAALAANGFTKTVDGGTTMDQIVTAARGQAQSGDVVLLSTACASFDLFDNYKDRGEKFKVAVQELV